MPARADRALTAAVAAAEYDFGECMEVCKRENARSDDAATHVLGAGS